MNKLKIPLYHGTSTVFLDKILDEGLGKTNIVKKYDLVKTLDEIYFLAKNNIEDWKIFGWCIEDIIQQKSGMSNWQHGQVYVTPSLFTATQYAKENKYGSEIVSIIIKLYKDLLENHISYNLNNEFILSILEKECSPIVIQINNISTEILDSETEDCLFENLYLCTNAKAVTPIQHANFRLKIPITVNEADIIYLT